MYLSVWCVSFKDLIAVTICSFYVNRLVSSLSSLWILPIPGRFTLLPSPTNSFQAKPGTNSCTSQKQTGNVLVMAADNPQHWGFLSVFCTSALVHIALPLSFRCSVRSLFWPFSAVLKSHLFLTFLTGSYLNISPHQSLLCCLEWWSDSQCCSETWFVHASGPLAPCQFAGLLCNTGPQLLYVLHSPSPASGLSLGCATTPTVPLLTYNAHTHRRLFISWLF